MKKSLLTLAVASSLVVAGAVQADTKVYGHAQVEIGSYGGDKEGIAVADNARGRIGFKNTEDLGGGLKSIAKFEFKLDTADGDSSSASCTVSGAAEAVAGTAASCKVKGGGIGLTKRELLVGLKGGFGQVELGRLKSAYKYYGGVKYDPFVATLLEARGAGGMSGKVGSGSIKNAAGHNGFVSDSIGYQNKAGNVSYRITYDLDDGGPANAGGATQGNAMTAGLKFGGKKKFEAGLAIANDGEETSEYSATKFFGMYNLGKAGKIKAQLEMTEIDGGNETDYVYVDYNFKMSKKNMIDASFGTETVTNSAGADVSDTTFTRVAFIHNFSKKTRFTAGYASSSTDTAGVTTDQTVIAVGVRKKF